MGDFYFLRYTSLYFAILCHFYGEAPPHHQKKKERHKKKKRKTMAVRMSLLKNTTKNGNEFWGIAKVKQTVLLNLDQKSKSKYLMQDYDLLCCHTIALPNSKFLIF